MPAVAGPGLFLASASAAVGDLDGDGIPDSVDLDDDNDGIPDTVEESGATWLTTIANADAASATNWTTTVTGGQTFGTATTGTLKVTTINPTGGKVGSDLKIEVGPIGQMQIYYTNIAEFYTYGGSASLTAADINNPDQYSGGNVASNTGVFISLGGKIYGPRQSYGTAVDWSPVKQISQSSVVGSGTRTDPWRVQTKWCYDLDATNGCSAGDVTYTQIYTYVKDDPYVRRDYKVDVPKLASKLGLADARDTYFGGAVDAGIGQYAVAPAWTVQTGTGAAVTSLDLIAVTNSASGSTPAKTLGFIGMIEKTPWESWMAQSWDAWWTNFSSNTNLNDKIAGSNSDIGYTVVHETLPANTAQTYYYTAYEVVAANTAVKPPLDTDGDGTPDYQDLDSDNDGIPDSVDRTGTLLPITSTGALSGPVDPATGIPTSAGTGLPLGTSRVGVDFTMGGLADQNITATTTTATCSGTVKVASTATTPLNTNFAVTYQWYELAAGATTWTALTGTGTSGTIANASTTQTLSYTVPSANTKDGYQYKIVYSSPVTLKDYTPDVLAPTGFEHTDTCSIILPIVKTDLSIAATSPTAVVPGTTATVTLTATNSGPANVTVPTTVTYTAPTGATITAAPTGCTIAADALSVTCTIATIANGASSSLDITVAVAATATPGTTLTGTNNVTLTNTAADSTPGNNTASSSITLASPQLKIEKSAAAPTTTKGAVSTQVDGGDTITYSFKVTNTGTAPIVGATVVDAKCDSGSLAPTSAAIAVGASQTFTCTHTLTQAEVDSGSFTNTASVTGTDTAGNVAATDSTSVLSATSTFTRVAQTEIVKSAATPRKGPGNNNSSTIQKGDLIDYTFTVTNTGNTTLTNVGISDAKCDGTPVLLPLPSTTTSLASLAPGATVQFGCTHTITQDEINSGGTVNTASVTATPPSGTTLSSATTSKPSTTTAIKQVAEYTLTKTSTATSTSAGSNATITDAGDKVSYKFVVQATGNLDLANVTVTDAKCDSGTLSPASVASLAVGASTTFTCTHTLTQTELDAGKVTNVATVAATATAAGTTVNATMSATSDATETVTLTPSGVVKMVKTAGAQSVSAGASSAVTDAGDTMTYTFSVTNTGNVTLNTIAVTDAQCTTAPSPASIASLAPGASASVTCSHTITAAEFSALKVVNTASISAKTPSGGAATTDSTSVLSITTPIVPPVDLQTTVSGPGTVSGGSTGTMTVSVDNIGPGNAASDATTTVTAPSGTTITAYTVPAGVTCTPASPIAAPGATTVTCTIPKAMLEVSDPAVDLAMTVSVPATLAHNTSLASGGASTSSPDPDPVVINNTASSTGTAVDTTPPVVSLVVDPVTADNMLNAAEAGGNVVVTGTVSGEFVAGDTVTLTVNGVAYTGTVGADGIFAIEVPGSELAADPDTTVDASVSTTDAAGNAGSATATKVYAVDTAGPVPTITVNDVTADNVLNAVEAGADVAITGTVTGEFKTGDTVTLTVNGTDYT
ncbi:MAG TPA: Ig-like domain-containing protein, partial [Dermatophilaceae bacterium]|nr:Ig-like domain-containing protein [Dermatophilaceae bacterium]